MNTSLIKSRYLFPPLAIYAFFVGLAIFILGAGSFTLVVIGTITSILFSAILFTMPSLGIYIYLIVVAGLQYFSIFQIGEQDLHADLLLSFIFLLVGSLVIIWKNYPLIQTGLQRSLILMLILLIPSLLLSVSPFDSFKVWMRLFSYFILLTLITYMPGVTVTRRILWSICLASLIPSLVGIYALVANDNRFFLAQISFYSQYRRVQSLMSHPNTLGTFLAIVLVIQISTWVLEKSRGKKILLTCMILLSGIILFSTYSRNPQAIFIVAFSVLLFMLKGPRISVIFLLLLVVVFTQIPSDFFRLTDILDPSQGNSLQWRILLWEFALQKLPDVWLFGSGLGTFLSFVQFGTGFASHNMYVGFLIETGVLGFLGVIQFLIVVLIQSWKSYRASYFAGNLKKFDRVISASVFALTIGILVGGLAGSAINLPSAIIYFFAIVSLVNRISYKKTITSEPPILSLKDA